MFLNNLLTTIYNNSPKDSTDYILARYNLMHITKIVSMSLTDISIETNISKGAVSKFYKNLTQGNSFNAYKSSLSAEIQMFHSKNQPSMEVLKGFNQFIPDIENHITMLEVNKLAKDIQNCKELIIYGDETRFERIGYLTRVLIQKQIDVRCTTDIHEIYQLSKDQVTIIISPNFSLYEFTLLSTMSIEVDFHPESINNPCYYIGKLSTSEYDIHPIGLIDIVHPCMINTLLEYIAFYIVTKL